MLVTGIAGCYSKAVTYLNVETNEPIPTSQLESLIQLSQSCVQSFHYDCTLAPLRDQGAIDYAWWTDRHGERNYYFTGENKGNHVCDCHFEHTGCFEQDSKVGLERCCCLLNKASNWQIVAHL